MLPNPRPPLPKPPATGRATIAKTRARQMSESKRSPLTASRRRRSARNAALVRHYARR